MDVGAKTVKRPQIVLTPETQKRASCSLTLTIISRPYYGRRGQMRQEGPFGSAFEGAVGSVLSGSACKRKAPKARNKVARGKCEAERSTRPLDRRVKRGSPERAADVWSRRLLSALRACSCFVRDPGAAASRLPLATLFRAFGARSAQSALVIIAGSGCRRS
jgi:hypothetical protein